MGRLILVVLDGLHYPAGKTMGFIERLDIPLCSGMIQAEMPTLSRPAYATLLTGLSPLKHGILTNEDARRVPVPTLFDFARMKGLITCAVAYSWFYELCNGAPFDPASNRLILGEDQPIGNALFYWDDAYPDCELFADAESLRKLCKPDFMLVHSMGIDNAGHLYGGESQEYFQAVHLADELLAQYLPIWLNDSFQIVILSDHGMDAKGKHGQDEAICRECPCWLLGSVFQEIDFPARATDIARFLETALMA